MVPRRLIALAALIWAGPARAVDQGDWQLSAAPAFAVLVQGDNPTSGLGGRIEGRYGLRDDAAAWVALGASWHPRTAETVRDAVASAGFALAYDVLRVVPFAEAGAAVADLHGAVTRGRYLGLEAALGAEYLIDRRWSTAAVTRYQYLPLRLGGTAPAGPGVLTVGLRIGRVF